MSALYFHGGMPGLMPGCLILPPTITKVRSCSEFGAAGIHRRDRVYLCTKPEGALMFAVAHPSKRGLVYQVEPIGPVEPDPDWSGEPGVSVQAEQARVIRVFRISPSVRTATLKALFSEQA